ncbi:hypothetical protein C5615_38425 [Burkholderia cepacia]|uniref:AttH domain-containing protein n=1 Tax=Burkholderia cepacia TaxID=292 RepID=A0A2S8HWH8_BURCE|nr:carotenoid 1,2-hydratase [Burkholderia cepacia]PQP06799.1 hypothetical protein C5615_38425 [Burkholderia cepacia]HDR9512211.1 carotenoid 1,2-hydratase [Burkholderia cepacia]
MNNGISTNFKLLILDKVIYRFLDTEFADREITTRLIKPKKSAPPIVIPRDESPHNSPLEWWYYTGHLTGADIFGTTHNYGHQMTFFRSGLGAYPLLSAYVGNFAITDLNRGAHYSASRISIQPDNLPLDGGYNIKLLDWTMSGINGVSQISGNLATATTSPSSIKKYKLTLNLHSYNQVVLNGDQGAMPPNSAGALNYYSFPNLFASGTVYDNGLSVPVTGSSWFDHEFGTPSGNPTGWHWYAIELSNGTKYNISLLKDRNEKTTLTYGTYIRADGTYTQIDPKTLDDFETGPTWTSPRSGVTYPTQTIVTVPGGQLIVTSLVEDQEMSLMGSTYTSWSTVAKMMGIYNLYYSENNSSVTGAIDNIEVSGKAYVEIVPFSSLAEIISHAR